MYVCVVGRVFICNSSLLSVPLLWVSSDRHRLQSCNILVYKMLLFLVTARGAIQCSIQNCQIFHVGVSDNSHFETHGRGTGITRRYHFILETKKKLLHIQSFIHLKSKHVSPGLSQPFYYKALLFLRLTWQRKNASARDSSVGQ